MHETGGSWYPATVTAYVPKGQPTPWRVAFDYDDGGAGAVLLDDELHSVRRAPKKAPDPKKAEPEPEPRGFDDFMAELTVEPAVEGAGSSAEMAELRRQLRVAHEESKRHEKARLEAVAHFERECVKVLYTMHCAHCTQCTALIMHCTNHALH